MYEASGSGTSSPVPVDCAFTAEPISVDVTIIAMEPLPATILPTSMPIWNYATESGKEKPCPGLIRLLPEDASGALKDIYDEQIKATGHVLPTTEIASLKPRYAALWDEVGEESRSEDWKAVGGWSNRFSATC